METMGTSQEIRHAVTYEGRRAPGSFLANARREAEERGLYDTLVVDMDCHHYESGHYREIAGYIDNPAIRRVFERYSLPAIQTSIVPGNLGDRNVAGRIRGEQVEESEHPPGADGMHPVAWSLLRSMDDMAIDYAILFPTPMLVLGVTPQPELEVGLARAYNRWLVRNVLPESDAIKTMLYLPLSDPDASAGFIEEFADAPGVLGFLVTCVRYQPIHENRFMKVFAALEERSLPLAFHSAPNWGERSFEQMNRFLGVHALGFPFYAMVQMTNLVYNGIPERFPNIPFVFMEAGVAWLPFMVGRLDNEYRMRSSEAPLLTRMPSDYIRDFHYTSQPIEHFERPEHMQMVLELFDGENRLMYSSDYPHQDFDLPSTIADLPCLGEEAKRKVLGGNAARLFGLDDVKLQDRHPDLLPRQMSR
ncbi:MAG: amidohydrolase [Actinobacteria bacterium]|nr:amidohydrolase [Actinomycetota bacterium]